VDFCCIEHRLVVEVDGGQHADAGEDDERRTADLQLLGFRVLRFWNNEALTQTDAVLERIAEALGPHPDPLPSGEREE
jgi:very-short-patch-repair endonuclease